MEKFSFVPLLSGHQKKSLRAWGAGIIQHSFSWLMLSDWRDLIQLKYLSKNRFICISVKNNTEVICP